MAAGLTGRALFDPAPTINREQAIADEAAFMRRAAKERYTRQTRWRGRQRAELKTKVLALAAAEDLTVVEISERLPVTPTLAHIFLTEDQ